MRQTDAQHQAEIDQADARARAEENAIACRRIEILHDPLAMAECFSYLSLPEKIRLGIVLRHLGDQPRVTRADIDMLARLTESAIQKMAEETI